MLCTDMVDSEVGMEVSVGSGVFPRTSRTTVLRSTGFSEHIPGSGEQEVVGNSKLK